MDRLALNNDEKNKVYAEDLLTRYRQGIYDLPTLAIMLLAVPELDVADLIQRSIPHEERWGKLKGLERIPNYLNVGCPD